MASRCWGGVGSKGELLGHSTPTSTPGQDHHLGSQAKQAQVAVAVLCKSCHPAQLLQGSKSAIYS